MTPTKRKISVSLDEDLVKELEANGENVSNQVNEAIRVDLDQRRRNRLLRAWLKQMDDELGPVPEELVQKYVDLLS
jgi:post-segregation antitoxin (ccd killing protein)